MKRSFSTTLATLALSVMCSSVFALGLPALPGGGSGGASSEQIVKKYVSGTKNVMNADSSMLGALGYKEQSEKAALSAKNLTEGATSDSLEDAAKIQTENSKMLEAKMTGEKVVMDAASKKQFAKGMIELAVGIKEYVGMTSDVKGYKPSVTSVGGAAGAAIFVVKNLPTSISSLGSTLKRAMDFAKSNNIAIPKEANEATALL